MKPERQKYPDLNDLAFKGRNKDYGSFALRRRYPRILIVSFVLSIVILLLLALIPLEIYLLHGPYLDINSDQTFAVDYSFIPNPEDDLNALAKSLAKPPNQITEEVPQVVDTVIPEKTKEEPVKTVETPEARSDTSPPGVGSPDGTGSAESSGIYTTLDVYPKFPGGDQSRLYFLRSNVRYPTLSIKSGVEGEVMVLFIVEADGSITNVSINRGIGKECDEEAMRIVKSMPRWEPGRRNGRSVRVLVRMPIVFKLPGRK